MYTHVVVVMFHTQATSCADDRRWFTDVARSTGDAFDDELVRNRISIKSAHTRTRHKRKSNETAVLHVVRLAQSYPTMEEAVGAAARVRRLALSYHLKYVKVMSVPTTRAGVRVKHTCESFSRV